MSGRSTQAIHSRWCGLITALLAGLLTGHLCAEPGVLQGLGGSSTNLAHRQAAAGFQVTPVGLITATNFHMHLGFLTGFLEQPLADADGDGVANENDRDDDGDGLADLEEITGQGFIPSTASDSLLADSDGDGQGDGEEAAAGTNPRDATSQLRLTSIVTTGGVRQVAWRAREGRTYNVIRGSTPPELMTNPPWLAGLLGGPGTGAWQVVLSTAIDTSTTTRALYRVVARP